MGGKIISFWFATGLEGATYIPKAGFPRGWETSVVWGRQGESKGDLRGRWERQRLLQSKPPSSCPRHQGERGQGSPSPISHLVLSSLEGTIQDEPWDTGSPPWLPVPGKRVHRSPSPQPGCIQPSPTLPDTSSTSRRTDAPAPAWAWAAERSPAPQSSRAPQTSGEGLGWGGEPARGRGRS